MIFLSITHPQNSTLKIRKKVQFLGIVFLDKFLKSSKIVTYAKETFLINAIFHQFLENCTIQSRKIFEKVTFQKGNTFYGTSSVLFGILDNVSGSNYVSHFRDEFVFLKLEKLNFLNFFFDSVFQF